MKIRKAMRIARRASRALAARTVEPVILAEQRAIVGMEAEMQQFYEIGQRHMERLRAKFEKL